MSDFFKLLVATEFPPNIPGGGGAIVRQMLKDWPADKLYWWSCQQDYALLQQRVAAHLVANIPPKLYPNQKGRQLKGWLLDQFWVPRAVKHFRKTLETVRPNVVWIIPHCWSIPPIADVLLGSPKVPFHFSIYDYPDIQGIVSRLGPNRCRRLAQQVDQLYAHAATRDTISQQMSDDLEKRTGARGALSRAGLEQEDFDYLLLEPKAQNGSIRIAYAGTIIAGQTFELFVKALARIRSQLPAALTLDFFGDHSYRSKSWFDSNWMNEHGNLSAVELKKTLKEYTWGFSPMDLTDDDPRYNRFSLPTKFVSYLISGLPIITIGHAESTVVKMASKYQVGACLTDSNFDNLCRQLLTALSEPNPKTKHRAEIQRCALAEFDARRLRANLYENFRKCASSQDNSFF